MSLTPHQEHALKLLKDPDPNGDRRLADAHGGRTYHDRWTVWINYQTALALERRGLIKIDKQMDGWDVQLIDGLEAPEN